MISFLSLIQHTNCIVSAIETLALNNPITNPHFILRGQKLRRIQDGPGQTRTDPDGPGRTRTDPDGPDYVRNFTKHRPGLTQTADFVTSCI